MNHIAKLLGGLLWRNALILVGMGISGLATIGGFDFLNCGLSIDAQEFVQVAGFGVGRARVKGGQGEPSQHGEKASIPPPLWHGSRH